MPAPYLKDEPAWPARWRSTTIPAPCAARRFWPGAPRCARGSPQECHPSLPDSDQYHQDADIRGIDAAYAAGLAESVRFYLREFYSTLATQSADGHEIDARRNPDFFDIVELLHLPPFSIQIPLVLNSIQHFGADLLGFGEEIGSEAWRPPLPYGYSPPRFRLGFDLPQGNGTTLKSGPSCAECDLNGCW